MTQAYSRRATTLTDYLTILGRRRWIIVVPLLLAPFMAVLLSSTQSPLYRASASVLINRQNIVNVVANQPDFTAGQDPERILQTQSQVARAPELADRVVRAAGVPDITAGALLASSSVQARANADVLDFSVANRSPRIAARLATAYATEYTKYRIEKDTAALNDALQRVRLRISQLRAHGIDAASPQFTPLLTLQSEIETASTLQTSNTSVLREAHSAAKIRPRTKRNGILGVLLGGILGLALASVAEALDKRVRSEEEVEETLGLPRLARIPKPSRRLRKENQIVMLSEPRSIGAEPVRKLRTNIEFINLERNAARTIMVTSSVQREGKSTTIANLGVALARAGRRVVLVDLDLRRPYLNRFFRVSPGPGITDVVLGRLDLVEALRQVVIPEPDQRHTVSIARQNGAPPALHASNGQRNLEGILNILPSGTIPPDAGDFVGIEALRGVLEELRERFDFVLIDAPPLLAIGDAMTLSARVDAMIVLVRLKLVQRGMLNELTRMLEACPADKLGYVLTGAELGEGYGYPYADAYEVTKVKQTERQNVP